MKADLTNIEIDELDSLLQQAPEALQPLDVVSLDGYLCAVAVQPRIVSPDDWLARALDTEGSRWPAAGADEAWLARVKALLQRRFEALVRGLADEGGFDPVVSDLAAAQEAVQEGAQAEVLADEPADEKANVPAQGLAQEPPDEELTSLPAYSRPLMYWASGFLYGVQTFEGLLEHPDDAVHLTMSRILRHLPAHTDEDRALVAELNQQAPLRDETHAIEDTVEAAVTLWGLTAQGRLTVRTVQRQGAKVGRNDPCPCGSGKKHKQCHGRA